MTFSNCHFDVASKQFLYISNDNRIHIWDIDSKKEKISYVDKNHLSHQFNCFAWVCHMIDDKLGDSNISLLSVGYSDGKIINWDLMRGIATSSFETVGTACPSGIAHSHCKKNLFVSAVSDNSITRYSLPSGEVLGTINAGKKGVSKIVMNPKIDVLAVSCGSSLKLLDVESGRKKKLSGSLPGGARCLLFSPCGCFLIASANRSSREVLIFDVRADAPLDPVYVVTVKDSPCGLDCKSSSGGILEILAVHEKGTACIFQVRGNYKSLAESGESPVLCMTEVLSKQPIISGFLGSINHSNLKSPGLGATFAVGKTSAPLFVHVHSHNATTGSCLAEVVVSVDAASSTANSNSSSKVKLNEAVALGPNETAGKKRPIVALENGFSDSTALNLTDRKESNNGEINNSKKQTRSEIPELTMEQRLQTISRQLSSLETSQSKSNPRSSSSALRATSDSLSVLIEQALQGGDDSLLEQCLGCSDQSIVDSTARRLPVSRVVQFLRKLVVKFEKRPTRGGLLTQWLSAILRFHTSFLITVPDLSLQLAGLSQLLESRLSSYCRLSSLAGRLDLLLSQVAYQPHDHNSNSSSGNAFKPDSVYKEEDDDDINRLDEQEEDDGSEQDGSEEISGDEGEEDLVAEDDEIDIDEEEEEE